MFNEKTYKVNSQINVYALFSPITRKIFYVGMTKHPVNKRAKAHYAANRLPSIKALRNDGAHPEAILLEVTDESIGAARENHWIATFLNNGLTLENSNININKDRNPHVVEKEKTILHLSGVGKRGYYAVENF